MVKKCLTKFDVFDKFIEYYSTFYRESKRDFIQLIKNKLNQTKEQNLIKLVNLAVDKYIIDQNFSYNNCVKDNENLKHIPVVVIPPDDTKQSQTELFSLGIDDYIIKPFVREMLMKRIDNVLVSYNNKKLIKRNKDIADKLSELSK